MKKIRDIYFEDDQDELLEDEELRLDEWAFMKGYTRLKTV